MHKEFTKDIHGKIKKEMTKETMVHPYNPILCSCSNEVKIYILIWKNI